MKRFIVFFLLLVLIFSSCKKDYLTRSDQVPSWLKERILKDEKTIEDNPKLMNAYGCWVRYTWNSEYYFEYHNVLSSSSPPVISYEGDTLMFYGGDKTTEYYKQKCCKIYVWKGPEYQEFGDL